MNRTDILYGVGLFLLTVLSRIPFRSRILYHWDSVNFAFAMRKFDVAAEQPQPPGYIVYVWLCRLADTLFHEPQTTMVWIAIVSSGLAIVTMYLLGRAMFDRRVGVVGAVLLLSSPLYWFYGEIALPHALDLFLVILSAWLLYEAAQGRWPYLLAAAASLAVAGGVRQQTPVFLGLLLLFSLVGFFRQARWSAGLRWTALSVVVGGLLCAGWFFPLIASAGGLDRYLQVMNDFSSRFNITTSLFMGAGSFGLTRNLRKLGMYTLYGWGIALVPFGLWILTHLARHRDRVDWSRVLFVVAWLLPALFFYTIIHMGQQGLVFVFLPALLLISSVGIVRLLETPGRKALSLGVMGMALLNALVFVASPEYPFGSGSLKVLSWDTLRNNDTYFSDRFDVIRDRFLPDSTAIVADRWRHVEWYLPEYELLPFSIISKWELGAGSALDTGRRQHNLTAADLGLGVNAQGETDVILFDEALTHFNASSDEARFLTLANGATLSYLSLRPGDQLRYDPDRLGLLHP